MQGILTHFNYISTKGGRLPPIYSANITKTAIKGVVFRDLESQIPDHEGIPSYLVRKKLERALKGCVGGFYNSNPKSCIISSQVGVLAIILYWNYIAEALSCMILVFIRLEPTQSF